MFHIHITVLYFIFPIQFVVVMFVFLRHSIRDRWRVFKNYLRKKVGLETIKVLRPFPVVVNAYRQAG